MKPGKRALIVALAAALLPAAALAHAVLLKSNPSAGAVIDASPPELMLRFSEEILPSMSNIVLVASDGTEISLTDVNDSRDVHIVTAPLPHLPPGGYAIRWSIVSADGHPVSGTYSFLVSPPPAVSSTPAVLDRPSAEEKDVAPVLAPLLRGLGLTALLALTGMLGFLTRAEGDRGPTIRPALRWTGALAAVTLFAHLIVWANSLNAPSWHAVLDSVPGRFEQLRVLFAILLLMSVLSNSKRSLGLFFGALAIVVSAFIGHPGAIRPLLSVPLMLLHLTAVTVWLGGIAWLVAHRGEPMVRVVIEAARVSNAAFIATGVVLLTGVAETALLLRGFADLVTTSYGLLVLAKGIGLAALIGFGWHHRFRVMPRLSQENTPDFMRTLRYELTIMAVVVVVAGFLSYTPPPQ